ncbi:MAG: carboxymuconolactone decarboxylase family protein [Caulobacter sp.]|nr:carboxymuconolactone decarboxylase family protein [Caulobacter sp.]
MPRIAPLTAPYKDAVQKSFDAIMPPGADPLALFRTLATSDRHWRKFRAGSLLDRGPLSLREREIVINRTCARAGCEYEWGVHVTTFAGAARLTEDQAVATVHGEADAPCWTPAEQALVATADALHTRARLSDLEWSRLREHFDGAQCIEVLLLCGFYRTVAYVVGGLDLPLEPAAARFPAWARNARMVNPY